MVNYLLIAAKLINVINTIIGVLNSDMTDQAKLTRLLEILEAHIEQHNSEINNGWYFCKTTNSVSATGRSGDLKNRISNPIMT